MNQRSRLQRAVQLVWTVSLLVVVFAFQYLAGVVIEDVTPGFSSLLVAILLTGALGVSILVAGGLGRRFPFLVAPVQDPNGGPSGRHWTFVPPWQATSTPRDAAAPAFDVRTQFAKAAGLVRELLVQQGLTLAEDERLRATIDAEIAPDLDSMAAEWARRTPSESALSTALAALLDVTPLLSSEMSTAARRMKESAADPSLAHTSAPYPDHTPDPGSVAQDQGHDHDHDHDHATSLPDPNHVDLGLTDTDALIDGFAVGTAFKIFTDWDDLVAGEIDVSGWIRTRAINFVQNKFSATTGAWIGGMLGGPVGAAVGAVAGVLVGAGLRVLDRIQKATADEEQYLAELARCDREYEAARGIHDSSLTAGRRSCRACCEQALAGIPLENSYPDLAWTFGRLCSSTLSLAASLPRWGVPGGLNRDQRRRSRQRLRRQSEQWLDEFDQLRHRPAQGRFLDALDLLVRVNQVLIHEYNVLVTADWAEIGRRLELLPTRWSDDRRAWSTRAGQEIQPCLGAYQAAAGVKHRDFLRTRSRLADQRLEALLHRVNQDRRRSNRVPLTSTEELRKYIAAGRRDPGRR